MKKYIPIILLVLTYNTIFAKTIHKIVQVNLDDIKAYYFNSNRDKKDDIHCQQALSALPHQVYVDYSINTITLQETATLAYEFTPVALHSDGVTSKYQFTSDGVGDHLSHIDLKRVGFSVSKNFVTNNAYLLFEKSINPTYRCVLSSPGFGGL